MKIRLAAEMQTDSIVDGEGIRTVIWTQGCKHNCKGCHNPETHCFDKGTLVEVEDLKKQILSIKNQEVAMHFLTKLKLLYPSFQGDL